MASTKKQHGIEKRRSIQVYKGKPTDLMVLDDGVERAYNRFWMEVTAPTGARLRAYLKACALRQWNPAMDVLRLNGTLVARIDLSGVEPEAIKISVLGDELIVSGSRWEGEESQTADYYLRERTFGDFCRRFHLPDGINIDGITATYENGVLEIVLPRLRGANPKVMPVESREKYAGIYDQ